MHAHRIALLIIVACWLFLPAVFEWWLSHTHLLTITFIFWGVVILTAFVADLRKDEI